MMLLFPVWFKILFLFSDDDCKRPLFGILIQFRVEELFMVLRHHARKCTQQSSKMLQASKIGGYFHYELVRVCLCVHVYFKNERENQIVNLLFFVRN